MNYAKIILQQLTIKNLKKLKNMPNMLLKIAKNTESTTELCFLRKHDETKKKLMKY